MLAFLFMRAWALGWSCLKKKKKQKVPALDILSHTLVPDIKVLSEGEKAKVLKKYGINEAQLPKIFSKDPAVEAVKAVPGNVIRIQRDDGTGKYISYRVVV